MYNASGRNTGKPCGIRLSSKVQAVWSDWVMMVAKLAMPTPASDDLCYFCSSKNAQKACSRGKVIRVMGLRRARPPTLDCDCRHVCITPGQLCHHTEQPRVHKVTLKRDKKACCTVSTESAQQSQAAV
jgi:hypothetical protein